MDEPYPIAFPFHAMAMSDNRQVLEATLEQIGRHHTGPILNQPDAQGRTPLHVAIERGHLDVVEILLNFGADPSISIDDDEGFTTLCLATLTEHVSIVDCLISAQVDPDQCSKFGFSALHEAARLGLQDIVISLIKSGAECDILGPDGSTPLCWAVTQGHSTIAETLLQAGANPNVPGIVAEFLPGSNIQMTPLYVAATNENHELVGLLLSHGAAPNHPNARGPGGHTALHESARIGSLTMAKLLLASGADSSVVASDGTTAADWAERLGNASISNLLLGKESL